jgi:hypothetical protein
MEHALDAQGSHHAPIGVGRLRGGDRLAVAAVYAGMERSRRLRYAANFADRAHESLPELDRLSRAA